MFNRLVVSPGNRLYLGSQGGSLILAPSQANSAHAPGSMSLYDMQCRLYHLLREDGPDTGYPLPTTGDFPVQVVTRDLNIAMAQYLSETGFAPDLCDRMDVFPVFPVLDYPVPLGLVGLYQIDYTPAGQSLYTLNGLSMSEWTRDIGGALPPVFGEPLTYREPFAGYVRLYPQPGPGNAVGPGIGIIALGGAPAIGDTTYIVVTNGSQSVTTATYETTASDTTSTIAVQLMTLVNQSAAVQGPDAFLQPSSTISNTINLTAVTPPGTNITYEVVTDGTTMTATPSTATTLSPNGDTITFYYSSLGVLLVNPGDVPNVPPPFCMPVVYRVLQDYWARKQDFGQATFYTKQYEIGVAKGKAYTYDSKRSTQPTVAGEDSAGYSDFVFGGD